MRGRHTSAGKTLDRSIRWLEAREHVKKVILGFTNACRHKYPPGHIRYQRDDDGGFHAKGYSGNGVVNLFVRVDRSNLETVKATLAKKFNRG